MNISRRNFLGGMATMVTVPSFLSIREKDPIIGSRSVLRSSQTNVDFEVSKNSMRIMNPSGKEIEVLRRRWPRGNVKERVVFEKGLLELPLPSHEDEYFEAYVENNYLGESLPKSINQDEYELWEKSSEDVSFTSEFDEGGRVSLEFEWSWGGSWKYSPFVSFAGYIEQKWRERSFVGIQSSLEGNRFMKEFTRGLIEDTVSFEGSIDDCFEDKYLFYSLINFVRGFKFSFDSSQYGWPEYHAEPFETVMNFGGDCEDLSLLCNGILEHSNFDVETALLVIENHAIPMVHKSDIPSEVSVGIGDIDIEGFLPIEITGAEEYVKKVVQNGGTIMLCKDDSVSQISVSSVENLVSSMIFPPPSKA